MGLYEVEGWSEVSGLAVRECEPVVRSEARNSEWIASGHLEIENDGGIGLAQGGDDAWEIKKAVAAGDFAEEEALGVWLDRHILEVNTQRERGESFDDSVGFFEQGNVVSGVDENAEPFAAELAY